MPDTNIDFDLLMRAGGPVRNFKAGDVIFSEGDAAEELLVVKSGTVEIRLGNRLLDTLNERSIFGEMALIDHGPRSATAVALTDSTLVPLGDKGFSLLGRLRSELCAKRPAHFGKAPAHDECNDRRCAFLKHSARPARHKAIDCKNQISKNSDGEKSQWRRN